MTNIDASMRLFNSLMRTAALAIAAVLLAGCNQTTGPSAAQKNASIEKQVDAGKQSDAWVNQELLLQLKEVRSELSAVKDSVAKLNTEVAKLTANGAGDGEPPDA